MAEEDGGFLRERAGRFRSLARELLEGGDYDFAAFHFQQAAELKLKYEIFIQLGDHPRTHALKQLIDSYGRASGRESEAAEFLDEYIDIVSNIENAYITARYLPGDFRQKEVENMGAWVDKLWGFVEEEKS